MPWIIELAGLQEGVQKETSDWTSNVLGSQAWKVTSFIYLLLE